MFRQQQELAPLAETIRRNKYGTSIFVAYAVLIAFVSLQPDAGSSMESYDKGAHLLAYGIFAALAHRMNLSGRHFVLVCIGIVAYSAMLEVAQSFVPGREMSALDLFANALGVAFGAAFGLLLRTRYFAKKKFREKV